MRSGRSIICVALLARAAGAQTADTIRHSPGSVVSGVVRDSIARGPLAGAVVELVAADSPSRFARTAFSDSLGRFTLTDVPDGRHKLGFFHPMLDSLGLEPPLREVNVSGHQMLHVDLAIPSPERLRAIICGGRRAGSDSGGVLIGTVRDAYNGSSATGATVVGEWIELSFRRDAMVRRQVVRRVAKTGENGWFSMCNVPRAGIIALVASHGSDSTDLIEVQAPAQGFLRHDLYLGPRGTATSDRPSPSLPVSPGGQLVRNNDGRLRGIVVRTADGRPLADAQISIAGGSQTRSNERGEWMLTDAPAGTRMIDVRALGYYPERRRVDVVPGSPSVSVSLSTLEAVLDTVRVRSSRLGGDATGFETRRMSGIGHFYTPADIARWQPVVLSEIFRLVPGVRLEFVTGGVDRRITVRGPFGECEPSIYINGQPMTTFSGRSVVTLTADDLDTWVRPHDVIGIEVYTGETTPVQYQQGMSGCGSILIWTKLPLR